MVAERLADRSEMCPTCDALVAGLSALVMEHFGVLPTAAALSARSAISERELVRHVGDPVGCFILAFERATDGILATAEAARRAHSGPPEPLRALVEEQLLGLARETPAGAVVLSAPRLPDPRIVAAVATWERRYSASDEARAQEPFEPRRRPSSHPAGVATAHRGRG